MILKIWAAAKDWALTTSHTSASTARIGTNRQSPEQIIIVSIIHDFMKSGSTTRKFLISLASIVLWVLQTDSQNGIMNKGVYPTQLSSRSSNHWKESTTKSKNNSKGKRTIKKRRRSGSSSRLTRMTAAMIKKMRKKWTIMNDFN